MVDVNLEELQSLSQDRFGLDYPGGLRRATGLALDPNGICRSLFNKELNSCRDELLLLLGSGAALFDGSAGSFISTPDAAAFDILGDIDIRVEFVQTQGGTNQALVSKWNAGTNQRSYMIFRSAFTTTHLSSSVLGTGATELNPFALVPVNPGAARLTLDVDNGASGKTHRWYTAPSMDDTWVQFDEQITAGVTSIFNSTSPLILGASDGGASNIFRGRITRMELRNSVGTLVASPDLRNLAPGTTSFMDAQGNTWTLNGSAVVV